MEVLKGIIIALVVASAIGEDVITSSEEDIDLIIDMLMKNEIKEYSDSIEKVIEEYSPAEPVYSNGLWKCGNCDNINESKLIYTEIYNVETNDLNEDFINLQVGLSLQKISCVTVSPSVVGELISVKRLTGNCAGSGATLQVVGTTECVVKVYE